MAGEERESLAKDLEATIAARAELGREYEPALVESFVERLDAAVAERLRIETEARASEAKRGGIDKELIFGSLGIGIPLTAIAGGIGDVTGLVIAWGGIVAVNVAAALSSRHRRR